MGHDDCSADRLFGFINVAAGRGESCRGVVIGWFWQAPFRNGTQLKQLFPEFTQAHLMQDPVLVHLQQLDGIASKFG